MVGLEFSISCHSSHLECLSHIHIRWWDIQWSSRLRWSTCRSCERFPPRMRPAFHSICNTFGHNTDVHLPDRRNRVTRSRDPDRASPSMFNFPHNFCTVYTSLMKSEHHETSRPLTPVQIDRSKSLIPTQPVSQSLQLLP